MWNSLKHVKHNKYIFFVSNMLPNQAKRWCSDDVIWYQHMEIGSKQTH